MPIISGGGSGTYTPPTTRAIYSGNNVSIADGAFARLTWDTLASGTALLSLAVPAEPTVVVAGIYAVVVSAAPAANMTANGFFQLGLELDAEADDPGASSQSRPAIVGHLQPNLSVAMTYYIPAGGALIAGVTNLDGVQALNYALAAVVQRLS